MRKAFLYFFIFLLAFRIFGYYFSLASGYQAGDQVLIHACLDTQPKITSRNQIFSLSKLRIITSQNEQINFGDCLQIKGKVGEKGFLVDPEIEFWEPGLAKDWLNGLKKFGFWLQQKAKSHYNHYLPEPVSSLLSGIVLGAKSNLPVNFYQKLQNTGTLHIVVASGYNLTVISQYPADFLAWFTGRKAALVLGGALVWLYVLVAGFQPPIIRAALIISLVYLARYLGRKFDVWRGFWLVIGLMLIFSPSLIASISFQLSVSAMFGLLYFEDKFQRLRNIRFVGKALAESLSAQLMVLPIIGFHFGTVSWASPLINMLVLPFVPLLMTLGLISLGARPFLYLVYPAGYLLEKIINFFGRFSFLQISFSFSWFLVIIYYLILFYIFGWRKKD
ncbi:MAG: ComEC/Rec2 family competence protein [Candidatus Shapirobacteria bacterium]